MNYLMWWFLIPLVLGIVSTIFIHERFKNNRWDKPTWLVSIGIGLGLFAVGCIILSVSYALGKASKVADVEIYNGQVISKERVRGSYERSYSCNCRTTGSGSNTTTTCDTCYEEHYTLNWNCATTIGEIGIDSEDSTFSSVYNDPDPYRYVLIKPGDPVAQSHPYVNYIKAVPDSLFQRPQGDLVTRYSKILPKYPDVVYDIYHVDRVLTEGVAVPDIKYWNAKLEEVLKILGPLKQANAVIILTSNPDPSYFNALQAKWIGGKKNDVILVIGASHFPHKADWVGVMALSQDSLFQIKLRDDIKALDNLSADSVIDVLQKDTTTYFHRKRMHDFKYLAAEIQPPAWVMDLAVVLVFLEFGVGIFVVSKQFE